MRSSEWLKGFKVALIEEDMQNLERLIEAMPSEFENLSELNEAASMLKLAQTLVEAKREKLNIELKKLKDTKKYMA